MTYVNPGFHYNEAGGTGLNIHDITGSSHSRITQCLKATKPEAVFDQDMTKFEELAGTPAQNENAREAPEAEPPQEDGRLPTINEESEAGLEAHIMEMRRTELHEERELLEATPLDDRYTAPTHMVSDNSVLVTVAEGQWGHLPKWGCPRGSDIEETHHVPLCSTVEDHSYGLGSDENDQY
eukprot:8008115-Pyramimonas_sp.AAC.1